MTAPTDSRNEWMHSWAWCVWIREGYQPDGVWFALTHMICRTRGEAIQAWKDAMEVPGWRGQNWRAYRSRDVAKVARIVVEPGLPKLDFPEATNG